MLRHVLVVSMLLLLIGAVRSGSAFDAGEPGDPMDQYQADFKRQNLSAALGIDQNTVERLLQIDQKYRSQKRQAIQDARGAFQQLQRAMGQPHPSDQEVAAILDNMMRLRKEKLTLEQNQLQEEKSLLTPVQQAKYILLLMNMRQQVAKEAQRVRSAPQGGAPMPMKPGGPHEVPVSRPGGGY
jgi:Spy/CpxP family protein refolding chaperone